MIPTVLHHMIVSSVGLIPTFVFPWKPNAPRHMSLTPVCPARLLEHLICQEQQGWGHRHPERLRRREVDDQLEFHALLDAQVRRLRPVQDVVHVGGGAAPRLGSPAASRRATRARPGTASLRSSSRFPMSSGFMTLSPVRFPPGRARLATNPAPTGSALDAMTMGMVLVACLAARAAAVV